MEKQFCEVLEHVNVRSNLSNLRQMLKTEDARRELEALVSGHETELLLLLEDEDAKTRKNIALLLGDLKCGFAKDAIFEAYEKEETLFVRGSYLVALANLEMEDKVERLKEILNRLMHTPRNDDNRKHIEEEIRALRKILIRYEGITHHTFDAKNKSVSVILLVPRNLRENVKRSITCGRASIHSLGVLVETDDLLSLMQLRTYKEMLFPLELKDNAQFLPSNPIEAATQLWESNLSELLYHLHKERTPFYYRVECKGGMSLEERSNFTKKFSSRLETLSEGCFVNSASDYEIEIRLIANKLGEFFPAVKMNTMKNTRFAYRKDYVAASIQPYMAALIMEVAESYLVENAQIMDPFCGVGTMLIERDIKVPAREIYATDTFGEAIEKGRSNARLAGEKINFIHRDFFDFKHDYKFDEIITNMPTRGKRSKEEMDAFYDAFFKKAAEILEKNGIIIMYTNELPLVKKNLRLNKSFEPVLETCMQSKTEYYVLIIRYKG